MIPFVSTQLAACVKKKEEVLFAAWDLLLMRRPTTTTKTTIYPSCLIKFMQKCRRSFPSVDSCGRLVGAEKGGMQLTNFTVVFFTGRRTRRDSQVVRRTDGVKMTIYEEEK